MTKCATIHQQTLISTPNLFLTIALQQHSMKYFKQLASNKPEMSSTFQISSHVKHIINNSSADCNEFIKISFPMYDQ